MGVAGMERRTFLALGAAAFSGAVLAGDSRLAHGSGDVAGSAAWELVPARMSDDICESYCISTKSYYANSVYSNADAVVGLLEDLGARIVRERVTTGGSSGSLLQQSVMPRLAAAGIRWHGTVGELADWPNAEAVHADVFGVLTSIYAPMFDMDLSLLMHSFAGCNEVDGPVVDGAPDPEWAVHARLMQQTLWAQAKGNPLTQRIPVAGPSTRTDVTAERAAELGDLSQWCDRFGNAHMYSRGVSPTEGIDQQIETLRPCFPDADRWIFSETGYNDSPQSNTGITVPEDAVAVYAIRGICDFFTRDAIYGRFELLDDPDVIDYTSQASIDQTADRQAHFGLVAMTEDSVAAATPDTWRKKPEYYATQRFLSLLSDRGAAFSPAGLTIRVTGGGSDLQRLVLQKRDDRHYLALWRNVDIVTPYPDARPVPVEPDTVTVELLHPRPVAVYEPGTSSLPVASSPHSSTVTVSLGGELKILELG